MGLFLNLFYGAKTIIKTTVYSASLYTFFAYFYVQEVKHRLGDTEQTNRISYQFFSDQMKLEQTSGEDRQLKEFVLEVGMGLRNIYTFYARAWNFRQFEISCKEFNHSVIKTMLKNYQSYGIFNNTKLLEKNLRNNEVNVQIIRKIKEVKEVNSQLSSAASNLYMDIIEKQIAMSTGSILGLSKQDQNKIDLLYDYIEKSVELSLNQNDYWNYKLMQNEVHKHNYKPTIFKLLFI